MDRSCVRGSQVRRLNEGSFCCLVTRSSGILLHPTYLPGRFGIGDFGDEARAFVDFLAAGGQSLWQVLPLGPTGYGHSPYQSLSAFAGNTLLIDPRRFVADGLLAGADLVPPPVSAERVDFEVVRGVKEMMLGLAFEHFNRDRPNNLRSAFE